MRIDLLAHRGFWRERSEQNTLPVLARALTAGFGLETDLRDHHGEVVVSHDPPRSGETLTTLDQLCSLYRETQSESWLALNVKADGLATQVANSLRTFGITNYFVFDMSVPDTLAYGREGVSFFSRQSELEPSPALYDQCDGIWLDAFSSIWYEPELIFEHLALGKDVCLVSPELHGRPFESLVPLIDACSRRPDSKSRLMICTDHPDRIRSEHAQTQRKSATDATHPESSPHPAPGAVQV